MFDSNVDFGFFVQLRAYYNAVTDIACQNDMISNIASHVDYNHLLNFQLER